jgi:hypothetical protein
MAFPPMDQNYLLGLKYFRDNDESALALTLSRMRDPGLSFALATKISMENPELFSRMMQYRRNYMCDGVMGNAMVMSNNITLLKQILQYRGRAGSRERNINLEAIGAILNIMVTLNKLVSLKYVVHYAFTTKGALRPTEKFVQTCLKSEASGYIIDKYVSFEPYLMIMTAVASGNFRQCNQIFHTYDFQANYPNYFVGIYVKSISILIRKSWVADILSILGTDTADTQYMDILNLILDKALADKKYDLTLRKIKQSLLKQAMDREHHELFIRMDNSIGVMELPRYRVHYSHLLENAAKIDDLPMVKYLSNRVDIRMMKHKTKISQLVSRKCDKVLRYLLNNNIIDRVSSGITNKFYSRYLKKGGYSVQFLGKPVKFENIRKFTSTILEDKFDVHPSVLEDILVIY